MASRLLCMVAVLFFCNVFVARAQKGNNELQIAGQLSFPIGDLAELAKRGHGFSAKGLWGVGKASQQITTEVGYSFLNLKDKWLTDGVSAYYGGFVLYSGYRYKWQNFFVEPQAGVAFYSIDGFNSLTVNGIEETKTYFDWALGTGYSLGHLDLAIRYQSAQVKNSKDINFIALRLGYKFFISQKAKTANDEADRF